MLLVNGLPSSPVASQSPPNIFSRSKPSAALAGDCAKPINGPVTRAAIGQTIDASTIAASSDTAKYLFISPLRLGRLPLQQLAEAVQATGPTALVILQLLRVRQQFMGQFDFGRAPEVVKFESYQSSFQRVIQLFSIRPEMLVAPAEFDFRGLHDFHISVTHHVDVTIRRVNLQIEAAAHPEVELGVADLVILRVAAHPLVHLLLLGKRREDAFAREWHGALQAQS